MIDLLYQHKIQYDTIQYNQKQVGQTSELNKAQGIS